MNEINNPKHGGLLLVGRDPGSEEMRKGVPFCGPSGQLLNSLLSQAGIRRERINITNLVQTQPSANDFRRHLKGDVERGRAQLIHLVARLRPNLIITCGNEASHALIEGWPENGKGEPYGIQERRGYLWTPKGDCRTNKILSTIHPAACLVSRDPSGINEMLLLRDLKRAKDEAKSSKLDRPTYDIEIVTKSTAQLAANVLNESKTVSCDIETFGPNETACIGFATSSTKAFVFTRKTLGYAYEILTNEKVGKVFQNGQFDLYHLLSRDGISVGGRIDDTMVGWHCLWPEIAAQRESRKGARRTHKSLAFLESIYGESPEWWKDYEFESNKEMYTLNGKDVCKTFAIWAKIDKNINQEGVRRIYEHERRMIWPCVMIQDRGMIVDESSRESAITSLGEEREGIEEQIRSLVEPLIEGNVQRLENPKLFYKTITCKCCRNGKVKRLMCWSCAGFDKMPSKKEMLGALPEDIMLIAIDKKLQKKSVADFCLSPCKQCNAEGSWEEFEFNPSSSAQIQEVLYNILKLPLRYEKGNVTANEQALKSILGGLG